MKRRSIVALGLGLAMISRAPAAHAVLCADLPNPVYVTGSGKVVIADLGRALSPAGVSLVYKTQGSCIALDAILNGTKFTGTGTSAATYWDATTEMTCDLSPTGDVVDVGISDVFPSTCIDLPGGLPMNVGDFFGPVEAYTFVVPKGSSQRSISANAAYFIAGFGNESGVAPWTDETQIFRRDASSGTQQMFAAAIGVPSDRWRGVVAASSADVVDKLTASATPEAAIGMLTTEVAGANRLTVDVLAYQARDQTCGYWPDSTAAAFDKRNVRDGHYEIWGPLHLLTRLDNDGYPINPAARDLIAYLTGTKLPPGGFDLISLLAQSYIIPPCAMQVARTSELGPLSSFAPERACGCYFELAATGTTTCGACTSDVQCSDKAPRCNYGYCETQ